MSDLKFQFIASGHTDVRQAIRQVKQDAVDLQRVLREIGGLRIGAGRGGGGAGAGVGVGGASRGGRNPSETLARQVARDQERSAAYVARIRDKHFADEQRKEEQAARRKQAAAAAEARREDQAVRQRQTRLRQEVRLEEGIRRQARQQADREARARVGREMVQLRPVQRDDMSPFKGVGSSLMRAATGGVLGAGALAVGVAGMAGRDALRLREVSNRLSINSRGAGQNFVDAAGLQKEFEQTAIATPGQTAAGIAEAVQAFVTKTGNLDVARKSQGVFATVASATGSDVKDVSEAAADLFQKFDITSMDQMADALAALSFQGKAGAFEIRDMAGQFSKLSAAASRFGLDKGLSGVKTLGGLTQIARSATGSPEQAATAVEATLRQLVSEESKIKNLAGVDVFTDASKTKTNDVKDILAKTIAGTGGDLTKLQDIFKEEGIRAISPLISTFNTAKNTSAEAGGNEAAQTAAGLQALRKALNDAIDAPGDYAELQLDAAQAQQDASAKLTAAWEKLAAGVGDSVIPMFEGLVSKLADSPETLEAFVTAVGFVVDALQGLILFIEDILGKKILSPEKREEMARTKALKAQRNMQKVLAETDSTERAKDLISKGKTAEATAMLERLMDPAHADKERGKIAEASAAFAIAKRDVGEAQGAREEINKKRSLEEFGQYYASLGTKNADPAKEAERVKQAMALARGVTLDPTGFTDKTALNVGQGVEETEQQAQARQAYARQEMDSRAAAGRTGDAMKGAPVLNAEGLDRAAKALMDAAAALQRGGSASVLGNPS